MSDSGAFALYSRLPVWAQNVVCSLSGLRMRRERHNRCFFEALRFLVESEWWSLSDQQAYQDEQLRAMIRHAYQRVPYYREVMAARRLTPDDIRTVADLPKLPILEKQTVRERHADLICRGWPEWRKVVVRTGGTTGKALALVEDVDVARWQWAVWWRHRGRFKLNLRDEFVVFAGRKVVPIGQLCPPIWRRNLPMHQTYVSVHHLTRQNMPALVDYLQRRRVRYYSGYPSALYLLAMYLLDNGIRLKYPPRITVTGAETVLPHQRTVIERALDTELADQYGASEHCVNISECECHHYHVDMEFGAVEFLPLAGAQSGVHRIISTGLRNPVMPLIRYNINDTATLEQGKCACGRAAPLVARIDGRIESYIQTPDGRQLGRLDFLFKESEGIEEAQLLQDQLDHVLVKVVPNARYTSESEQALHADLRKYLGHVVRIDIEYVAAIPREANGKFRQIVSRVFQDRSNSGTTTA